MLFRTRRHVMRGIASLAVVLGASCSTTRTSVTQVWQSHVLAPSPMKSMIVFGARMDVANRRELEDGFVVELARHDVKALPSYTIFPDEPPDREKARDKVKELGLDGILVVNLKKFSEK